MVKVPFAFYVILLSTVAISAALLIPISMNHGILHNNHTFEKILTGYGVVNLFVWFAGLNYDKEKQ